MNANTAAPATRRMPITIAIGLTAPRLKLPSSEANAGLFMASSGSEHARAGPGRGVGLAARYRKGWGREAAKRCEDVRRLRFASGDCRLGDDDAADGPRRGRRTRRARA